MAKHKCKRTIDGRTRQQEVWDALKAVDRQVSVWELVEVLGRSRDSVGAALFELRSGGHAYSTGSRMRLLWSAGATRPPDGRAIRKPPPKKVRGLPGAWDSDFMICLRREGTPGEIPRIPTLAQLLQC